VLSEHHGRWEHGFTGETTNGGESLRARDRSSGAPGENQKNSNKKTSRNNKTGKQEKYNKRLRTNEENN
jgi:hypothetical protein